VILVPLLQINIFQLPVPLLLMLCVLIVPTVHLARAILCLVPAQEHKTVYVSHAMLVLWASGRRHPVIPSIQEMILTAEPVRFAIPLLNMKQQLAQLWLILPVYLVLIVLLPNMRL
jgi:hypothetical protein